MLTNCGVKFAGRAVYQWGREGGGESALPKKLELAKKNAAPDSCGGSGDDSPGLHFRNRLSRCNKSGGAGVGFRSAGSRVEKRNFRHAEIIYPSGLRPQISQSVQDENWLFQRFFSQNNSQTGLAG